MTKMCVHRVSSRRVRLSLIRADPLMKGERDREREREHTGYGYSNNNYRRHNSNTSNICLVQTEVHMMTSTPMTSLFAAALLPLPHSPFPSTRFSVPVCLFICLTFRCYASLFYFLVARQLIAAETTTTATTQNEIKSSDAASAAWAKVEIPFNAQWPRPLFPHYSQHTRTHRTDDGVAGSKGSKAGGSRQRL